MAITKSKIYLAAVIAAGTVPLIVSTVLYPVKNPFTLIFFVLLGILFETQSVLFESGNAVSITSAAIFCALITSGPTVALWAAALSVLGMSSKLNGKRVTVFTIRPSYTFFNASAYVFSILAFELCYFFTGGKIIFPSSQLSLEAAMIRVTECALPILFGIFFSILANMVVVGLYRVFQSGAGTLMDWIVNFIWSFFSLFVVGLLGIILTAAYISVNWFFMILFFAPFLLARYVFLLYKDLQKNYLQTVKSLAAAIEAKDEYTIGHSKRVEAFCSIIAQEMHLSPRRAEALRYAALLHDIGKIGIDDRILNKSQGLSDGEWSLIRQHPETGAHIVEDIEFLSESVKIIRAHHERVDGTGYPSGLAEKDLPIEAMILTVADSYDAMTSSRPYRSAPFTHDRAMAELKKGAGHQFSRDVVEAFERAMRKKENQKYVN